MGLRKRFQGKQVYVLLGPIKGFVLSLMGSEHMVL